MKRVIIFTANSIEKIHPRIEMQQRILEENGFEVRVVRTETRREGPLWEIINLFGLKYFKFRAIKRFSSQIGECDIAHIYDLQLLPLAKKAKRSGKHVIYETLDDNVFLNFHAVSKKIFIIRPFKKLITGMMSRWERNFSGNHCDRIIVNSPNLLEKFVKEKVDYIPYTSPLEGLGIEGYDAEKETVFLYLGKLTVSKGTREYAHLLKQHKLQLFFFGKAYDKESVDLTVADSVHSCGNLGMKDLRTELRKLFERYNPVGLSIIIPENESYALQEANKDIDYISMGIPFIGNERKPTMEKIRKGTGVLWNEDHAVSDLLGNRNAIYDQCVQACKREAEFYSNRNFTESLLKTYSTIKY